MNGSPELVEDDPGNPELHAAEQVFVMNLTDLSPNDVFTLTSGSLYERLEQWVNAFSA
jgi:hypothetical protein